MLSPIRASTSPLSAPQSASKAQTFFPVYPAALAVRAEATGRLSWADEVALALPDFPARDVSCLHVGGAYAWRSIGRRKRRAVPRHGRPSAPGQHQFDLAAQYSTAQQQDAELREAVWDALGALYINIVTHSGTPCATPRADASAPTVYLPTVRTDSAATIREIVTCVHLADLLTTPREFSAQEQKAERIAIREHFLHLSYADRRMMQLMHSFLVPDSSAWEQGRVDFFFDQYLYGLASWVRGLG